MFEPERRRRTMHIRLINGRNLEMVKFPNPSDAPRYAILSHRWGRSDQEMDFEEYNVRRQPSVSSSSMPSRREDTVGWKKISGLCAQALQGGIQWVWIDTCCIKKSDSSELSEAINSMYDWYRRAAVCMVYLDDVPPSARRSAESEASLSRSKWFKRGWTLQELLAPRALLFFSGS